METGKTAEREAFGFEIREVEGTEEKQQIARSVLESLTDWFGNPEAREDYIHKSGGWPMVTAFDEKGAVVDGDRLTAIFSKDLKERGLLNKDTAVVSAMTNMGFGKFAEANGINVVTTKVGDRYILEQMIRDDYSIGGEQSGYIIFGSYASTGDGELTAVQLLSLMRRTGKRLSELAAVMERYPQVMINVRIAEKWKEAWKNIPRIEELIGRHQETLGAAGRILVRESGTEPFIRVMIEGRQFDLVNRMAVEIADRIRECCPGE